MKKESLDIGGSVGSIKGNFYEKHFSRILENLGYKVVQYKEYIKYKDKPNIVFHKYRTAPDQFTEIDFFIPTKNIGFWVTNLGQIERYKTESSNKDFNEFKDLKGKCPHCKKSNLPNLNDEILGKWTCKKCKKIVSPFDLFEKKSVNGENVLKYKNNSASTQAHKQAYYRVGEYIEARTSEDKVACIEIIYNKRSAWRNWSPVIELFFDDTIFIFDDIGEVIGTDEFEKKLLFKIARLIKNPPQPKDSIKLLLDRASSIRDEKMKSYQNWLNEIIKSRLLKWGKNEPVSFPIRYSLYGLLKSKNRPISEIDVYIYSVLIKIKSGN